MARKKINGIFEEKPYWLHIPKINLVAVCAELFGDTKQVTRNRFYDKRRKENFSTEEQMKLAEMRKKLISDLEENKPDFLL